MTKRKLPRQMPSWERNRLVGAVDSDPADEEPSFCEACETDQPDDEDIVEGIPAGSDSAAVIEHAEDPLEVTAQQINFDGSAPLPPWPRDEEKSRHDGVDPLDGKKFTELPPRLMLDLLGGKHFYVRFPLPYSIPEMKTITSFVPPEVRADSADCIVFLARKYLVKTTLERPGASKPSPQEELENLRDAVSNLQTAIRSVSVEARRVLHLLPNNLRISIPYGRPQVEIISRLQKPGYFSIDELGAALNAFQTQNEGVLQNIPPNKDRRGAKRALKSSLQADFEKVFLLAHGGRKPKGGFAEFLDACCEPIGVERVDPESERRARIRARAPLKNG
ncbi:hypothetical protein EZH22_14090 [Xanthobacter dioxanivorans]|uniref:Uncharacterized protein n=1 Tax=Xanthobacter dioxanivorans TaxID=2528964 RepID=A0A974PT21_9HYPH|nr:hypothetical protein [Xanthobacter dioxanivorans]QRG09282.1 hypothetical protein EZH22_14090 [Xanthobacter dioxanivorans]